MIDEIIKDTEGEAYKSETEVEITEFEAKKIIESASFLDSMNKKYGYPHGVNPMGIVIDAVRVINRRKR